MAYYEYMNELYEGKTKQPQFVTNGGSFYDPENYTYVTYIEDNRNYYIPDTLVELTKEQVLNRALEIHSRVAYKKIICGQGLEDMTEQDVIDWVNNYFTDMENIGVDT